MKKVTAFLTEAWAELKKVVWPSRAHTIRLTLAVLGVTFGVAGIVAALDLAFNEFFGFLIGR